MRGNRWTGLGPLGLALALGGWLLMSAGCEPPSSPSTEAVAAKGGGGGTKSVTITAADPDTVPIDTVLTVRVIGSGFAKGDMNAKVTFLLDDVASTKVTATAVEVLSPTELTARTTVSAQATLGTYRIAVDFTDGKRGVGAEWFEVVAKPVLLDEPAGMTSEVTDLNDAGVVVGMLDDGPNFHAARWQPQGEVWVLENLGFGSTTAVNNAGEILVHRPEGPGFFRAHVRLVGGTEVDLGEGAVGVGMSEDGTVVGFVGTATLERSNGVLWPRTGDTWGNPIPLPLMDGYTLTRITDISPDGRWITGFVANAVGNPAGVVWARDGSVVGDPAYVDQFPATPVIPYTVSSSGAIAGQAWPCGSMGVCPGRPAFWARAGGARQLVPIIDPNSPDVEAAVYEMNDHHHMVGFGPVPIPTNGRKSFYMTLQPALWTSPTTNVVDISSYRRPRAGYATAIDGTGHLMGGYLQGNGGDTHAIIWIVP